MLTTVSLWGFYVPDLVDSKLNSDCCSFRDALMTVVKPQLPSLFWIWHPGLKFVVLPAAEGTAVKCWTRGCPRPLPRAGEQPCCCFWALGCWPSAHWHFAPTGRLCRCYWTVFRHRTKDGHFWNKNRGLKSVWCLLIFICTGFLGACSQSGWTDPWEVPAPFTTLTLTESASSHFSAPKCPSLKLD